MVLLVKWRWWFVGYCSRFCLDVDGKAIKALLSFVVLVVLMVSVSVLYRLVLLWLCLSRAAVPYLDDVAAVCDGSIDVAVGEALGALMFSVLR
jgi:hypothetical protein